MSEEKPVKTDIDYDRSAILLKVQSLAAAAGPALAALVGEVTAELSEITAKASENLKVRAEEAKAKAAKLEADAKAKAEADAKAAAPASADGPKVYEPTSKGEKK